MSVSDLVKRVHHTAICVQDFDAMRGFLVDFLGFAVEGEIPERSEAELSIVVGLPDVSLRWGLYRCGDHRVELFHYFRPTGKSLPPAQCDTGFTHLAFEVSDVHAAHERAIAAGYRPNSKPQPMRGGVSQVFYLQGPEGLVVEFMQFRAEAPA
ncbi:MAG: VOC family protein [Pseudomonadota bacterium]|uniref:VOC family protein n=1 Tax=Roseovarius TaxID=74030 RepID=UPI0022A795EF|nr:VOC family protein [Roseovarius sp. EGI FJ00037]MCZ0811639.1 VOC family protein [Roseovarius sp. EGI FJ00037]